MYDIIVVGAGCAGLTAALYARRADKSVLVLERGTFGGQITFSPKVENYPGIKQMSGNEFADMLVEQVLEQGADIELGCAVGITVTPSGEKTVICEDRANYSAKAVILATGARHRTLGVEGEEALTGHGISYCAVCDGAFYRDTDVAVIGGGNSALQEALQLSDICRKVTIVQNLDTFTGEARLLDALKKRDNVDYITGTVVAGFESDEGELSALVLRRVSDGESSLLKVNGAFVAIGLIPDNGAFADAVPLDERGYFDTDESCTSPCEGIYTAGDCRAKGVRQLTTAAADGSVAALAACRYIDSLTEA